MAPVTGKSAVLTERPDELIDQRIQELGPDYLVICSLFRGVPGAMGGGTWPGIRSGIHVPIVRLKEIATAASDLLVGGARIKVVVETVDETGNRHRVLPPWFETLEGSPRAGAHWESLTIAWDPQENGGQGAFVTVPRQGFQQTHGGSGQPASGPSFTAGAAFPQPLRALDGRLMPPPQNLVPGFLRQYPVDQQWDALANEYARVNGGRRPSLEPVDVAMQWKDERGREVDRAQVQAARYEERYESVRDRAQQQLDAEKAARMALEKRLGDMETRHARELGESQAKAREDRLEAQIKALESRLSAPAAAPAPSAMASFAPFAPVVGTVLAAWLQSNAQTSQRQTEMMQAIITRPVERPQSMTDQLVPLLTAASPILGPLMLQYMQNQSPEKLGELRDQSHMQGQAMISMMMEFIKWSTPSETPPPWWLEPLKSAIDGVVGTVKIAAMGGGMGQPARLPQPPGVIQRQPTIDMGTQQPSVTAPPETPAPSIVIPPHDLDGLLDRFAEVDNGAAQMTKLVMSTLAERNFDPRILTPEWATIVFAMHRRDPIRELVPRIVDHLEHSRDYSLLPGPLGTVFEDADPIGVFVNMLPVAQADSGYAQRLIEALTSEIRTREDERKRALAEDDEDEPSGETTILAEDEDEAEVVAS